jgi:hypothetical protein
MKRLFALRAVGWLCVGVIAYLSLIPQDMEVRTGLLPGLEHSIAYAGTAGLLVLGYPGQAVWLIIGSLSAYSGLMEVLQSFSPGRHPAISAVLWSSAGAVVGGLIISSLRARSRGRGRKIGAD